MASPGERRALQAAIALGCLVPISAGTAGIGLGGRLVGVTGSIDLDSHIAYLSGLLLAIGLGFASTIPAIERQGARFRLLAAIVVIGGIGRLLSALMLGLPSPPMSAALVMELVVTPALALWHSRIAAPA